MEGIQASAALTTPAPDTGAMAAQARSGDPQAVEEAAAGFESIFTSILLKEMRGSLEPGVMFGEDEGDIVGGLFDLHIGQHLARGGTFGIAQLLKAQLAGRADQ